MGRTKKMQPDDSKNRYRTTPEELDKLKAERLIRMKRFLRGGGKTPPGQSDGKTAFSKTDDGAPQSDDKTDLYANTIETAENHISEQAAKEIKNTFEGNFTQFSAVQREVEETRILNEHNEYFETTLAKSLTPEQIKALEMACHTDDMIDDMLNALEEAGANQRWLTAAKVSLHCGMMEISRAILRPKGF